MRLLPRPASRLVALVIAASTALVAGATAQRRTSHAGGDRTVVLIVADGLRWQEIFTGADSTLMNSDHGGIWADSTVLQHQY
jgi:hypothetical protein